MPRSAREEVQLAFDCDVDRVVLEGLSALPDLPRARAAAQVLARCRGDRAVFALCLLTLELARHGDEEARAQLSARVGVLLEAFRHPTLARVLVAGNPGLTARWEKIRPIVGEFVSSRRAPADAQAPAPSDEGLAVDVHFDDEDEASLRGGTPPLSRLAKPVEIIEGMSLILDHERSAGPPARQAPPPDLAESSALSGRPSAQRQGTPDPPAPPAAATRARPPPPPPQTGETRLPEAVDPCPIDPATRAFWNFTEVALGRVPDEHQNLLHPQCFIAEKSADRASLVRFARELMGRFPKVPQARALASLTLLYVAGQEKVRGLLGVNRERLETIRIALSLLSDPEAGGHAAVLFESDGGSTRRSFVPVVDILHGYLAYCLKHELDPKKAEAALRFTKG
jgi:hypothetical protein